MIRDQRLRIKGVENPVEQETDFRLAMSLHSKVMFGQSCFIIWKTLEEPNKLNN
jgi:hypothetical protein